VVKPLFSEADPANEVLVRLGEVSASVQHLLRDFGDEKIAARDNRAAMHRRLDEQARELSALKAELTLSRRAVEDMARTQSETVLPAVGEWRDMKTTGLRIVGVLAIGGVSVGATLAWFSDQAVSLLRHWLRIG
jgi:predicted ribosomally synthesized peptide with SipW-like signal peptide